MNRYRIGEGMFAGHGCPGLMSVYLYTDISRLGEGVFN